MSLSKALDKAKQNNDGAATTGGLSGALARRSGQASSALAAAAAPKTSNIVAVEEAVKKGGDTRGHGIYFVIDATGSRSETWNEAQRMQAKMFDAVGGSEIGIVYFRGGNMSDAEVTDLGRLPNAAAAKDKIAGVRCEAGPTQIAQALGEAAANRPSSIILVGDMSEENIEDIKASARELKDKGIKVYAFIEGDDFDGHAAYKAVANITGGVFKSFGDDLSLTDLCEAAAVYDTGGIAAFLRLTREGHKGARALERDLNRRAISAGPSAAAPGR